VNGVKAFVFLVAMIALIVAAVVLGGWLVGHTVEPYGDPTK
jgi:hypothetical protein